MLFKTQNTFNRGRGRGNRGRNQRGRGRGNQNAEDKTHKGTTQQSKDPQNQRGRGRKWTDKSIIQCYYCRKYGHYESECRKKQSDQNKGGRENVSNNEGESSEAMFLSCHTSEEGHSKDLWLLDSGCNNHMTGNKDLISCMDTSIKSEITLGDDSQVKSLGKGIVYVLSKQNQKKDIHDVYYVPNLKHNLISVGQLMEHGYDVLFKGSTCLILDKSPSRKLIAKIQMTKNRMFP
jgi:sarcosine oxidase delta subunit